MHMEAIREYAKGSGLSVSDDIFSFSAIRKVISSKDKVLFSQSTGISSALVIPLARIKGIKVIHYMHEPTPLSKKIRENPFLKSLVWHAVQQVEMWSASRVLVSRETLLEDAIRIYKVSPEKMSLAPLLMQKPSASDVSSRKRVTYLGRIDDRRFIEEFLKSALLLENRGFLPTLLTGDVTRLETLRSKIPEAVEVIAQRNFSESLKKDILCETLCLWNPKRGEIAQSGVTADAIRYGVSILLTESDPQFNELLEIGIAHDFFEQMSTEFKFLDYIDQEKASDAAAAIFSDIHGERAFVRTYLGELS